MATNNVPIEIVLQDPNNPIVPDTPGDNPGENTNISVPDTALGTGYTTKDGSSTGNIFTGSNATVSIASIVVLVLALGAIVALLVRRYQKHKKNAESKEAEAKVGKGERLATVATGTLAVLAATVLVGQVCMTATNAATSDTGTTLTTPDKIQIIANRYEDVTIVASTKAISYATTDTSFGYKIFMSMAGETANLYLDGDTGSQYYFAPTTKIGLGTNSWGYSFSSDGEDGYLAMPLAADPLMAQQNTSAVEGEEFTVYYTMKADKDMPFGVYSGEIAYDIQGYNGFPASLTTMQGMTSAICDAVYTPSGAETVVPTATLIDTRDNKTYTVAKLADGNCWMTQNLDLDLSAETALVPATSNVSNSWTPENSTIATGNLSPTTWPNNTQANYDPYSYDPGDVFYYSSGTTNNDDQYTSLEDCQAEHPDCSMKNHAGNYYSWSAAVANNDTSSITSQYTNVDTDICPAGWELPTGPNAEQIDYNDMGNLLASYDNITKKPINEDCGGSCNYYSYVDGGFNAICTAPLWLARSGYVYYGSPTSTGGDGRYWSSTVNSSSNAYYLYFSSFEVRPTVKGNRYDGYSVRCVAQ